MSLELILGAVFGGGFATLIATVAKVIDGQRKGKIESEDTVLSRLENENRRANKRADEAEEDAVRYRREMMNRQDEAAAYRARLIEHRIDLPPLPFPHEGTTS